MSVSEWLTTNEVDLYLKRESLARARKSYIEESGEKCSSDAFRDAVHDTCRLWKTLKRKPIRESVLLNEKGWLRLRNTVEGLLPVISGRPLFEVADIVRAYVPVNASLLRGLPSRLHVWKEAK